MGGRRKKKKVDTSARGKFNNLTQVHGLPPPRYRTVACGGRWLSTIEEPSQFSVINEAYMPNGDGWLSKTDANEAAARWALYYYNRGDIKLSRSGSSRVNRELPPGITTRSWKVADTSVEATPPPGLSRQPKAPRVNTNTGFLGLGVGDGDSLTPTATPTRSAQWAHAVLHETVRPAPVAAAAAAAAESDEYILVLVDMRNSAESVSCLRDYGPPPPNVIVLYVSHRGFVPPLPIAPNVLVVETLTDSSLATELGICVLAMALTRELSYRWTFYLSNSGRECGVLLTKMGRRVELFCQDRSKQDFARLFYGSDPRVQHHQQWQNKQHCVSLLDVLHNPAAHLPTDSFLLGGGKDAVDCEYPLMANGEGLSDSGGDLDDGGADFRWS